MAGRGGADPTRWSGRNQAAAREWVAARLPAPCGRCGRTVDGTRPWNVGHKRSRASFPELTMEPSNWQPECRKCSDASAQAAVIEKARRDALREHGIDPDAGLPGGGAPGSRRPSPRTHDGASGVRPELTWANFKAEAPEWLGDVLEWPEDASPPLATTPVHPRSTGTYGPEACEWIERELAHEFKRNGGRLRHWQRFAVYRTLEHDADGLLVWRTVLESAPRRAGKSVRLRAMALWRIAHPELFGDEAQLVIHTGRDLPVVREIHRKAWHWAELRKQAGEPWSLSKGQGQEEVIYEGVNRWLVRSTSSVYGYDATNPYIDEAWDVDPTVLTEGLEPATLERVSPQSVLTSTAHRRATSLMKTRIASALAAEDYSTLLMLWAAPAGSDYGDPDAWRAASPHWSQERLELISAAHARAEAGEADPEADDPDPVAGFTSQFLNVWDLKQGRRPPPGAQLVTEDGWEELEEAPPPRPPDAVAVEAYWSEGASCARAWREGGRTVVSVTGHRSVAEAMAAATAVGAPVPARVGKSLTDDPAVQAAWHEPAQDSVRNTVADLARMLGEGSLRHDGGALLAGQVLDVRVQEATEGLRVVSKARHDAVKAAVWAAEQAAAALDMPLAF